VNGESKNRQVDKGKWVVFELQSLNLGIAQQNRGLPEVDNILGGSVILRRLRYWPARALLGRFRLGVVKLESVGVRGRRKPICPQTGRNIPARWFRCGFIPLIVGEYRMTILADVVQDSLDTQVLGPVYRMYDPSNQVFVLSSSHLLVSHYFDHVVVPKLGLGNERGLGGCAPLRDAGMF